MTVNHLLQPTLLAHLPFGMSSKHTFSTLFATIHNTIKTTIVYVDKSYVNSTLSIHSEALYGRAL